jgi:hypothetical protein
MRYGRRRNAKRAGSPLLYCDDRGGAGHRLTLFDLVYCVRLGKEPLATK